MINLRIFSFTFSCRKYTMPLRNIVLPPLHNIRVALLNMNYVNRTSILHYRTNGTMKTYDLIKNDMQKQTMVNSMLHFPRLDTNYLAPI